MITARRTRDRIARAVAFGTALALALAVAGDPVLARTAPEALAEVALADLPKEARDLRALIDRGGPFHYSRDGVVFGNREQILPAKPRGYYHEYTVPTPGEADRGARRIVAGGGEYFYSPDHYQSFRRIRE